MKKTHLLILLPTAFLILAVWVYMQFVPIVNQPGGVVYELKPGTSIKTMITELSEQGITPHPFIFALYAYPHVTAHLKTGEYHFQKGSTHASIWKQVANGMGFMQYPFTIIPGWTFIQLRDALLKANKMRSLTAIMTDRQIMSRLGAGEVDPEGEFFPETYYYTKDVSDLVILKRAYDLMQSS